MIVCAREADEHGVDVGDGVKDGAGDRTHDLHAAGELGDHGRRSVGAVTWCGGEPLADLALDHGDPAPDAGQLLDRAQEHSGGDSVGEVGDDLGGGGVESGEVALHRVTPVDGDVAEGSDGVLEGGAQARVDLDDVEVAHTRGDVLGEHAEAAADLEHDVLTGQLGGAVDHAEDVGVDEEVLPEVPVGPHSELAHPAETGLDGSVRHGDHHQPNTRAALHSTMAPSSDAEIPLSSAMNLTVWTTKAG